MLRRATILVSSFAILAAAPSAANAAKVTNTHDSGPGSLRNAIAHALDDGDTVKVPAGHYRLTSGPLVVNRSITLVGASARKTVLDANGNSRVIETGGSAGTVTLAKLTVREGDAGGSDGGGILATHDIVLDRVALLNNSVGPPTSLGYGGGLNASGDITIRRSLFAHNHAYNGGAVEGGGTITATDSTFYGNRAGSQQANGDGGAFDDPVTLIDSTVVGNVCFNGDNCGAGIDAEGTITDSILAENIAYEYMAGPPGSPGNPAALDDCAGSPPLEVGFDLSRDPDCGFMSASGPLGLGKLKNNGGPTDTVAITKGSVAFNGGTKQCTARDQRGVKRPQGSHCDIGAYERKP